MFITNDEMNILLDFSIKKYKFKFIQSIIKLFFMVLFYNFIILLKLKLIFYLYN